MIDTSNKELSNKIVFLKSEQLYENKSNYELQSGRTYTKRFWWGIQRFMSHSAAINAVRDLRRKANDIENVNNNRKRGEYYKKIILQKYIMFGGNNGKK